MNETPTFFQSLQHGWNAFKNKDPSLPTDFTNAGSYSSFESGGMHRTNYVLGGADRTIIASIYTRISVDVASSRLEHARVDDNNLYVGAVNSNLNEVLSVSANIDQTGRAFVQDLCETILHAGYAAAVPIDTNVYPKNGAFDVNSMRVGVIKEFRAQTVLVEIYNEENGQKQNVEFSKRLVAIIQNPFYGIMNHQNSTLKRLSRRLSLMDIAAEKMTSGKLDIIMQLPYALNHPKKIEEAKKRQENLVNQLTNSEYGIAYADATERITQLNRPVENNSMQQVEYLTKMLYGQLGITQEVMDGTASEAVMANYYKRTIDPIVNAIIESFNRTFLTKTARTQGQTIRHYRDPFSLTTTENLAEIADKFTRNEILTSNEFRAIIGYKPSDDPNANKLRNSNLNHPNEGVEEPEHYEDESEEGYIDE